MSAFQIIIKRSGKVGRLSFAGGGVALSTTCWWDPKIVVVAKPEGYPSFATRMASKKDSVTRENRPGIWLGKAIPYGDGNKTSDGIFIHEGRNADWSDGCIVCDRSEFMKIWAVIPPGGPNVLVKVTDETPVA